MIASQDPIVGLTVADSLGARVNFFEWNSPLEFHDGTSNFEVALSELGDSSVQVAAAGNLAGADHCMKIEPVTPNVASVRFSTHGFGAYEYRTFWMGLTWTGELDAVSLAIAGSQRFAISAEYSEANIDGVFLQAWRQRSSRGTSWVLIMGSPSSGAILPNVVLAVEASSPAGVSQLRGLLYDDQSGWSKGVSWLDQSTDEGTALMPSTADRVIGVGAYGGNHDLTQFGWGAAGERRVFSGVGPRLDGARVVDITAPDDPYATGVGAKYSVSDAHPRRRRGAVVRIGARGWLHRDGPERGVRLREAPSRRGDLWS